MILHVNKNISKGSLTSLVEFYDALFYESSDKFVLITSSKVKEVDPQFEQDVLTSFTFGSDIQLASKDYTPSRKVNLGKGLEIGGTSGNTLMIAGPCSVESEQQINTTASFLKELGIKVLRGGCYKPRTSPYSFQGLGLEGLKLLQKAKDITGQLIITEVRDATHVDDVIEYTDIIQIGAKAMYDHGILKAAGKARKPVMLKRGFGTTLQEFVQAAEFILSLGNSQVILCERGIRTFETKTRFTLDLCGVAYLKEYTNLPVILDPSHAMGHAYGVADLTRACVAMGVDGLIIEVHPEPVNAKSDASQQLNYTEFQSLYQSLFAIAKSVNKQII